MKPEEAIDILQAIKFIDDFDDYSDRLEIAIDMGIEALKEKPHGEWIDLGDDMILRWVCSKCGRKDRHIFNFCPDCGADMRKEGETK